LVKIETFVKPNPFKDFLQHTRDKEKAEEANAKKKP